MMRLPHQITRVEGGRGSRTSGSEPWITKVAMSVRHKIIVMFDRWWSCGVPEPEPWVTQFSGAFGKYKKDLKHNTTIQHSAVCSFGHDAEHMGRCPGDRGVRLPNVVDAKDCFGIHFETPLPGKLGCVFDDFCPLRTLFSPFGRRGGGPCAARGRPGGPEEGSSPI